MQNERCMVCELPSVVCSRCAIASAVTVHLLTDQNHRIRRCGPGAYPLVPEVWDGQDGIPSSGGLDLTNLLCVGTSTNDGEETASGFEPFC